MRSIFTLSLLFCMLQNLVDDTKAVIRISRVKIEPKDPIVPSWLEGIIKKSGKRTRKEVLDFMQNIGIKFVRANVNNASTNTVPSAVDGVKKVEIIIEKPEPTLKFISDVNVNETEKMSADIRTDHTPSIIQVTQAIVNKTESKVAIFLNISGDDALTVNDTTETTVQTRVSDSVSSVTRDIDGMKHTENKTLFATDALPKETRLEKIAETAEETSSVPKKGTDIGRKIKNIFTGR